MVCPDSQYQKRTEDVRICVDLSRLNKAVKRERFILPTIDDIWQIPLEREKAKLMTFITPMGRFFFKQLPFGKSSALEIFQREMSLLFRGHEGVEVYMDDILVHGRDEKEHEERL